MSIGDTGIVHNVIESRPPYANFTRNASFSKPEKNPPYGVDRVMALGQFGKDVVTTSTKGHRPLPYTGHGRTTTYKNDYHSERRLKRQNAPYSPNSNASFVPGGIKMPTARHRETRSNVQYTTARPPPMHMRPPSLPRPSLTWRTFERVRPAPELRLESVKKIPQSFRGANEIALPRASNRFLNNGSDTGESTNDISFTISKDSSANESVRNAKLLAEMGERNQRHRGGNDTDSYDPIAYSDYDSEEEARYRRESRARRRYMEDVDEDGTPIDGTRTYIDAGEARKRTVTSTYIKEEDDSYESRVPIVFREESHRPPEAGPLEVRELERLRQRELERFERDRVRPRSPSPVVRERESRPGKTSHFSTNGGGPGGFNFSNPDAIFAEFMRNSSESRGDDDYADVFSTFAGRDRP